MSLNASMMAQALLTKNLGKGNVEPLAKILVKFPNKRQFVQKILSYLTLGKSAVNYSNGPMQLQYTL